ncbi:MAG: hypothetical protein D6706_12590 [Chloroflexi bacterium]|nr:MAG: hypothetical protein D6706_12590 [Chloroflexota bacterium]
MRTLPFPHKNAPMTKTKIPLDAEFDITFADEIARLEAFNKHHYRPNTYLHKWWARRCGSTFRLILKHLVDDPALRDYYAPGGLAGKVILDPMMGGGTTLHEAIRLGANVIGVDIDPIPVLQARATLSDVRLVDLEQSFRRFFRQLQAGLGEWFVTTCPHCARVVPFRFVLYGLRRFCACGPVLVMDSAVLRHDSDGTVIRICERCHQIVRGSEGCSCPETAVLPPIVTRSQRHCQQCSQAYREDTETPFYARYEPLVIVGRCPDHHLFFKAPDAEDKARWQAANQMRHSLNLDPAHFEVSFGPKSRQLIYRGVHNYLDLFSSRQLLYLEQTISLLPEFEPVCRLNLALLVSTSLEFNSMLCGYKGRSKRRAGAIRHTFSHHAYSFPYTALENNPLYPRMSSGTLQKLFHARIRRGRMWARAPRERVLDGKTADFIPIIGERDAGTEVIDATELQTGTRRFLLLQGSATRLALADESVDFVVTDPPYFDSVQYSDLAAFFRVWLRQLLPDAADWGYDVRESAVDPHKNDRESRYRELMTGIFQECYRVLRKENGRLVFTFHHWNPKGWAALTYALKTARFVLLNRYVVHAENPISVHIANMNALLHDAIFVLAPAHTVQAPHWSPPATINRQDSYQFCLDCATLLGWMLNTGLETAEIEPTWRRALSD